jgi:hypothetical protein
MAFGTVVSFLSTIPMMMLNPTSNFIVLRPELMGSDASEEGRRNFRHARAMHIARCRKGAGNLALDFSPRRRRHRPRAVGCFPPPPADWAGQGITPGWVLTSKALGFMERTLLCRRAMTWRRTRRCFSY